MFFKEEIFLTQRELTRVFMEVHQTANRLNCIKNSQNIIFFLLYISFHERRLREQIEREEGEYIVHVDV